MTIEALAEEAVTLDPNSKWLRDSRVLAEKAREWMIRFSDKVDRAVLAKEIRKIRKRMVEKMCDPRIK